MSSPLASRTVTSHLVRGAVGLAALVAALATAGPLGPLALLFLPVAVIAWRGCPTCWAIGLMQTREACATGRCRTP
jgi:hypothetical protein